MGFDSKCDFAPPTIFLGFLCPGMWGISSQSLQCHTAAIPGLLKVEVNHLCDSEWERFLGHINLQ